MVFRVPASCAAVVAIPDAKFHATLCPNSKGDRKTERISGFEVSLCEVRSVFPESGALPRDSCIQI